MTTPSFRDVERLSAYLDGQLSQAEKTRLEMRLRSDPELVTVLEELRQSRSMLRRTPQRRVPRNFTLTPKMAGIRPPVPRAVPALSWASAVAALLFIFTLGTNLVGQLSFGASAPMMAAAPASMNDGGQTANAQPEYGVGGGPGATQPPVNTSLLETPTAETFALAAPEATPPAAARLTEQPSSQKAKHAPFSVWSYVWLGLAVLLIAVALFVRWVHRRAFLRKNSPTH